MTLMHVIKVKESNTTPAKEIIQHFHEWLNDTDCIAHLYETPSKKGHLKWRIIFSKANMADKVMDNLVQHISMTEHI